MGSAVRRVSSLLQYAVCAIVAALVVVSIVASLYQIKQGTGSLSFAFNLSTFTIRNVAADSPEAAAGVHDGDRILFERLSLHDRLALFDQFEPDGARINLQLQRGARVIAFAPRLQVRDYGLARTIAILLRALTALIFLAVGVALALLRPTRMTWGFFYFSAFLASAIGLNFIDLPGWAALLRHLYLDVLRCAGLAGFVIFAARFPRDETAGVRALIDRAAIPLAVICAAATVVIDYRLFALALAPPLLIAFLLGPVVVGGAYIVGSLALLATYVTSRGADRKKVQWVVAAFAFAIVVNIAVNIVVRSYLALHHGPPNLSAITAATFLAQFSADLMPLAIAYAVIRHRVIDVRFAISRALVYTLLTVVLVGIFSLIDWLIHTLLAEARLAVLIEIAAGIAAGFWINFLHHHAERFTETVLFRKWHEAVVALARAAAGLPYARTKDEVYRALVDEPVAKLRLTSAALFEPESNGAWVLRKALGWDEIPALQIPPGHRLLANLESEAGALSLPGASYDLSVPPGDRAPVLAFPVKARRTLAAAVLYGPHTSGADLDRDETDLLTRLATSAGLAYDHLEAEQLRERLADQQRRIDLLFKENERLKSEKGPVGAT